MNMNQGKNINMKEIFSQKITNEEKIIACSLLYQSETNPLKKEILFENLKELKENGNDANK